MPPKRIGRKQQHDNSWIGSKWSSWFDIGKKQNEFEYPGSYADKAREATHAYSGAIRPLPPLSAAQVAEARGGLSDDSFRINTGFDPNQLAFGDQYTF